MVAKYSFTWPGRFGFTVEGDTLLSMVPSAFTGVDRWRPVPLTYDDIT